MGLFRSVCPVLLMLSIALPSALLLTGCGKGEFVRKEGAEVNTANNLYARERFTQAVDSYRQFLDENPDSPFRKSAIIGLADSLYKDKQYMESALYYERFIELYPLDGLTSRAAFYLAMCSYHNASSADRDQSLTAKAEKAFALFIAKYPESALSGLAKKFRSQMLRTLEGSDMEIARYYWRLGKNQAAIGRIQKFLEKWKNPEMEPEALYMLGDCYYREQAYKKAAGVFSFLMKKFPSNSFSVKAARVGENMNIKNKTSEKL